MHREAMEYAQQALIAQQKGDADKTLQLNFLAFELEKKAALSLVDKENKEPDRSILFRSAASLALSCELFREAEKLVNLGLSGEPPEDIANELRDLYEEVNFNRHLDLKGESLDNSEIQLSISGNGVSFGLAPSDEFNDRVIAFEQLAIRSAERLSGRVYRLSGQPNKTLKDRFNTYLAVPKAASFAVKIRFGKPTGQTSLDIFSDIQDKVIDEVIDGISLINERREEELKVRIPDQNYYQNFLSLTKALAPDGDVIKLVGITVLRQGKQKSIALTKKQSEVIMTKNDLGYSEEGMSEKFVINGILRVANAIKSTIQIVREDAPSVNVTVPSGLSDVVKLYWEDTVMITVVSRKSKLTMVDIEKHH